MKKIAGSVLFLMILVLSAVAEGQGEAAPEGALVSVSWRYMDSSVPPQYHRSYTISITADAITVVVDSYGDLVAKKIYPSSPDILNRAGELLREYRIHSGVKRRRVKGCTGGNGEAIGWETAEGKSFFATVYHCGGQDEGTLYGDTAAFGAWCRSLVPDLGDLLKTPLDPELP